MVRVEALRLIAVQNGWLGRVRLLRSPHRLFSAGPNYGVGEFSDERRGIINRCRRDETRGLAFT